MDVSPSLDLTCPQAKTEIENMSRCLEREVTIKTKYGHGSIMLIIITAKKIKHRTFIIELYHILLIKQ